MNRSPAALTAVHLIFVLTGAVTTLLGAFLPFAQSAWRIDYAQAGIFFAAQFTSSVVFSLVAGALLLRISFRTVMTAGALAMAAGVAVLAYAPWPAMLAGVAIYGAGIGLAVPSANLWVGSTSGADPASSLNLLNFSWTLGAVVFPPLLARGAVTIGLRRTLLLLALTLVACAVLQWLLTPRTSLAPAAEAPRVSRRGFVALVALMLFLYVGAENGFAGWIATLAIRLHSVPIVVAGWSISLFWIALLAGRMAAPLLLTLLPTARMTIVSLLVAFTGGAGLLSVRQSWIFYLCVAMTGFGLAPIFANIVAVFTTALGPSSVRSVGPVFAASGLGGAVIPWLIGLLSQHVNLQAGIVLPVAVVALLVVLHLQLPDSPTPAR